MTAANSILPPPACVIPPPLSPSRFSFVHAVGVRLLNVFLIRMIHFKRLSRQKFMGLSLKSMHKVQRFSKVSSIFDPFSNFIFSIV
jgi:hypothetical protein